MTERADVVPRQAPQDVAEERRWPGWRAKQHDEQATCSFSDGDSLEGMLRQQLPTLLRVAWPVHAVTLAALSVLEAYIVSRSESKAHCTIESTSCRKQQSPVMSLRRHHS